MTASEATSGQATSRGGSIVSRFAPSPTGRLHLGHALSAMLAHDLARAADGCFLVRIEDIDGTRSRPAHVDGILADLAWLGLTWDGPVVFQSARLPAYAAALDRLHTAGLLYPCFCTRADIAAATSAPHGPDGVSYPGTCRGLDARDRMHRPHAWRLDMTRAIARTGPLDWHDATAGRVAADPATFGDVVLARKDAPASYHLAVTIDDAWQGVTDVARGADLFAATHVHRLLQALLDLPSPRYHHHPLLRDGNGRRLAKRHDAPALVDLRAAGADPADVLRQVRAGIKSSAQSGPDTAISRS